MYLLLTFLVLSLLIYFFGGKFPDSDGVGFLTILIAVVSILGICVCLIMIPLKRIESLQLIRKTNSYQNTIQLHREFNVSEIERAALTQKILEINAEIIEAQYWNTTQWDWWYDDSVMNIKPIE